MPMTMGGKGTRRLTMRLLRLFIVAFAPSVWFNDVFVTILELERVLEDDWPKMVCETPVAVPAERTVWGYGNDKNSK